MGTRIRCQTGTKVLLDILTRRVTCVDAEWMPSVRVNVNWTGPACRSPHHGKNTVDPNPAHTVSPFRPVRLNGPIPDRV